MKPKTTSAQQQTLAAVKKHIINVLDRASEDDENYDAVQDAVWQLMPEVDTSAIDVDALVDDPALKRVFREFVGAMVGTFQLVSENEKY